MGNGSLYNALKNIAKKRKNIFFHNYVDNPFSFFKNKINLLCITSKFEGTPNIMGEAMAFGIPVLAPREIGLTKLFLKNEKFGYLYKSGNSNSFSKKISEIISNYNRAIIKGKKAHQSLNRFNKHATIDKVSKIILRI